MATAMHCNVCGNSAEALAQAPMGGAIGDRILASVCKDCWAAWLDQQARVINHYGLQLAYPDDRNELSGVHERVFSLRDAVKAYRSERRLTDEPYTEGAQT